jgi:hypothetical protein
MSYTAVTDFRLGMDRRRPRVAGTPGTLWTLRNALISRGGDIERPKKFVPEYTLPEGTFGLSQINGQLWTFGSADLAGAMPVGVQYQRLVNTLGDMTGVLASNTFDGKHDVIASFSDGSIQNFYDGVRVDDWDTIAAGNTSFTATADYLARKVSADPDVDAISSGPSIILTSAVPGTAFTVTPVTFNFGAVNDQTLVASTIQANVPAVAEVRATGHVTITGGTADPGVNTLAVTVNGVAILVAPLNVSSSVNATATALAVSVNNNSSSGYTASAAGAVVTLRARAGTGAAPNGHVVTAVVTGNATATTGNMAGGVAKVLPVAQVTKVTLGGTFEAADAFIIGVNGRNYTGTGQAAGTATSNFVYKGREYFTAGGLLYYSKLNDPSDISDPSVSSGAGFINLTNDSEGSERLVAIGIYQSYLAIFSNKSVRIYNISTDSGSNEFQQTLENTGTLAPRSVIGYGNVDIFYLDQTGIRSVQARNVANVAAVDDAGSAIDSFVQEWVQSVGEAVVERAVSVIDPLDGRAWLAVGGRVFVLSYFPKAKITAWSYLEPGFTISEFARAGRRVYARSGNTIYLYGGISGAEYDEEDVAAPYVELPFVSASTPATFKKWLGFDMACKGTWEVDILPDPDDETKVIPVGRISKTTYGLPDIAVVGDSPLFAMRLRCVSAGFASLSSLTFHYQATEAG